MVEGAALPEGVADEGAVFDGGALDVPTADADTLGDAVTAAELVQRA